MTGAIARLRARRGHPEEGSITLFVAVAMVCVFLVIALVVDGGGKLRALNHAQASAQEAARAGADTVNTGQAISGDGITIDREAAQRAATAYLAHAGVTGTVSWGGDGSIVVDVTEIYTPVSWPGTAAVTGHASAKLIVQGG
ncbi:pilus assembly protein TadG-related protein [Kitasatospora sp. GP82]|uniref:pilus assembly protein TadG-related protein n=1 Tax=Kitasatospora sp. GP82 TaxID=3035089 RepID=UPI002476468A|nr:pilus assembly protein TadG-related protein [Kitasatospora sp. GP82]MDH6130507.1 Flp pilus assembly protein TadG [Kitasatospora sp. GP82]